MPKGKGCGNCFYKRFQFVESRGNPKAPFVIVGESPGATELQKGLPMMGPSGKVLMDALPNGFDEKDFYIINALECLPRRGTDAKKNMAKLQSAVRTCNDCLKAKIAAHPRKVILALGNGALWGVTGNYDLKITQVRGTLFPTPLAEHGIVPTVHPAFLLRGGGSYQKFKLDIEYAISLLKGESPKEQIVPVWSVAETAEDVKDFIDYTYARADEKNLTLIGADLETGGFDFLTDEILAMGWAIEPEQVFIVPEELCTKEVLGYRDFTLPKFKGGRFRWHWHNGKFDIKFLWNQLLKAGVDEDSMLMSYTMEERRGYHDLEQVAGDEIGAPDYKDMLKPYLPNKKTSYRVIPKPVLYKYLALDVSNTLQIHQPMHTRLMSDARNATLYNKLLLPASELLAHVEWNGMKVDFKQQAENVEYYTAIMNEHSREINRHAAIVGLGEVNPNSPKQLTVLLYDKLKLSKVKKGTGEEILDKLPQHDAVVALKKYRKAAKAYGTYVKPLPDQVSADGRVHSTYLIHGTATGRLSSRGPNMQNQPREKRIRGQFCAEDGHMLVEFDLDQAELRCLGALSRDPELIRIYNTPGLSLHKEVSVSLWGEDWIDRYKIDTPGNPVYDQAKEEYMRTKALNFGIVYGREANSIAEEFEVSHREAQVWIDGWAKRFPLAWKYIEKCRLAPVRGQNLVTPFGRRKRAGVLSREKLKDLQNEAANFPHQSIASDITLYSAIKLRKPFEALGIKIVNLVHDAIIVEMPIDDRLFQDVAAIATYEMEQTPLQWGIDALPFSADAKVGETWGELHDRKFERVLPAWYEPVKPDL